MNTGNRFQSRRSFLKMGAATVAGAVLARTARWSVAAAAGEDPYGGLKMGLQSYTLRDRSFDKALEAMQNTLKLKYVEIFPKQLTGISPPQTMEKLQAHGVTALSYGVVPFKADEAKNRKLFELAKAMGLVNLTCDPDPDAMENVDKLCHEFNITAAIHPHGPTHRWGHVSELTKAFAGRSPMLGLCADTGHLIRAGEDPLKVIQMFKDRLHAVHLKDFKKEGDNWEDVPAGEANLDVDGLVKSLLGLKFEGGIFIEYEGVRKDDAEHPVKAAQQSLDRFKEAVKKSKG